MKNVTRWLRNILIFFFASTILAVVILKVKEALTQLNDNERVAVTLYYIEDQPIKQVAKIMNMPEGSVKSLIYRSRDKMKQFIDN